MEVSPDNVLSTERDDRAGEDDNDVGHGTQDWSLMSSD